MKERAYVAKLVGNFSHYPIWAKGIHASILTFQIAVNKPSGLQVLPGGLYQQRTVLTQLQWHACKLTATSSGCQKTHPVPVHRLGRGTSGELSKVHQCMIFCSKYTDRAKNEYLLRV